MQTQSFSLFQKIFQRFDKTSNFFPFDKFLKIPSTKLGTKFSLIHNCDRTLSENVCAQSNDSNCFGLFIKLVFFLPVLIV